MSINNLRDRPIPLAAEAASILGQRIVNKGTVMVIANEPIEDLVREMY